MAWTTARKNRARDRAARLGELQNFIMGSPIYPFAVLVVLVVALGLVGAIDTRM